MTAPDIQAGKQTGPRFFAQPEGDFPIWVVKAAAVVAIIAIGGGLISTRTGIGQFETPAVAVVESQSIALRDDDGETVSVVDGSGTVLQSFPSATGGFVVESLRNLDRQRARSGTASDAPYSLSLLVDGRLVLTDPSNGSLVELRAFGEKNARQFLAILLPSS